MADAALLSLEVATPTGHALTTECESLTAPSVDGEFGVFPGHLPLLAALRAGVLTYRADGRDHIAAVGPGFVEAGPEKVSLLTDCFARPEDVDASKVRDELADAEKRQAAYEGQHVDLAYREIERDIEWAHARLAIVGH